MNIEISTGTITAVSGAIVGALSTATLMWAVVVRPVRRGLSWLDEFRSDWSGVPDRPGVPGRPGMMVRQATSEAAIAEIRHEVQTNSGGSLRDAVNATQTAVAGLQRQMDQATLIMPQRPLQGAHGASETTVGEIAA